MPNAVRAIHSQLPLPQQPEWSGYWTFVTAAIVLAFVLFIAQKGTLSTWISFLSWTNPAPLAPVTGGEVNSALGAPAPSFGNSGGNSIVPGTQTPGQPGLSLNPFAGLPSLGSIIGGFNSLFPSK